MPTFNCTNQFRQDFNKFLASIKRLNNQQQTREDWMSGSDLKRSQLADESWNTKNVPLLSQQSNSAQLCRFSKSHLST